MHRAVFLVHMVNEPFHVILLMLKMTNFPWNTIFGRYMRRCHLQRIKSHSKHGPRVALWAVSFEKKPTDQVLK